MVRARWGGSREMRRARRIVDARAIRRRRRRRVLVFGRQNGACVGRARERDGFKHVRFRSPERGAGWSRRARMGLRAHRRRTARVRHGGGGLYGARVGCK